MKKSSVIMCIILFLFVLSSSICAEDGYRGRRYHGGHHEERFYIEKINITEQYITLCFNIPVNPSFNPEKDIIIKDEHLPPDIPIKYNKSGNRLTFPFATQKRNITPEDIRIQGVKSWNGLTLDPPAPDIPPHRCSFCRTDIP